MPDDNAMRGLLGLVLRNSAPFGAGLLAEPVVNAGGIAGLLGQPTFSQQMAEDSRDPPPTLRDAVQRGIPQSARDFVMGLSTGGPGTLPGIRAYHGSPNQFDRFDLGRAGSTTDAGQLGRGIYASTDPRVAQLSPNRYEVNVNLRNPLELSLPDFRTSKEALVRRALGLPENAPNEAVTDALRARGHDGVVLDYAPTGYGHREVMAMSENLVDIIRKYGIAGLIGSGTGYGMLAPTQQGGVDQ